MLDQSKSVIGLSLRTGVMNETDAPLGYHQSGQPAGIGNMRRNLLSLNFNLRQVTVGPLEKNPIDHPFAQFHGWIQFKKEKREVLKNNCYLPQSI